MTVGGSISFVRWQSPAARRLIGPIALGSLLIAGCGMPSFGSSPGEALEGEVARCMRIPKGDVSVTLDDDGSVMEVIIRVPDGREDPGANPAVQACLAAIPGLNN